MGTFIGGRIRCLWVIYVWLFLWISNYLGARFGLFNTVFMLFHHGAYHFNNCSCNWKMNSFPVVKTSFLNSATFSCKGEFSYTRWSHKASRLKRRDCETFGSVVFFHEFISHQLINNHNGREILFLSSNMFIFSFKTNNTKILLILIMYEELEEEEVYIRRLRKKNCTKVNYQEILITQHFLYEKKNV